MLGRLAAALGLVVVLAVGCGSPPAPCEACDGGIDAGAVVDGGTGGGVPDAGVDAGPHDAGSEDAGLPDAGPEDAGLPDAGLPDAGADAGADAGVDAGLPAGTCGAPIPLAFAGDVATAMGSTTGAAANVSEQSCLTDGPERVYTFTLAAARSVTVEVTPTGGYRPTVSLHGAPCATATRDCVMAPPSGPARLELAQLAAGTWFVVVDGDAGSSGSFTLTVTLGAPLATGRGESCADPYRTALSGSTLGNQMTGDTLVGLGNDAVSDTCDGVGADRVYRLNLTAQRRVTLSLTASSSTPLYRPVLYVQAGACSASGDLACDAAPAAGGAATLTFPALAPGTYYIWLDTFGMTTGAYTFTYTLAP